MTSMEQIEYISVEARKRGMKYGEYVEKYGHTLPKPKPVKSDSEAREEFATRKRYKKRDALELICGCGKKFTAKTKSARFCAECKRKRKNEAVKRSKKKKGESEDETKGNAGAEKGNL